MTTSCHAWGGDGRGTRGTRPSWLAWLAWGWLALMACCRAASPAWFDPSVLHAVRLTMTPEEWTALLKDGGDFVALLGPPRTNGPAERGYRDHAAALVMDGERWEGVRVRKRGFVGSFSRERPSLNIEFPSAQDRRGPRGWRRVTLANTQQDASSIQLSAAMGMFRALGLAASRTALATVEVNGENLGVYTLVEPVDRDFLARTMGSAEGGLWEGTLADFDPGLLALLEPKRGTKASEARVLEEVARALGRPGGPDMEALGRWVDLDAFLTFWAAEVLVDHWDGYANNQNNFLVHQRARDGRLVFIPWGADQCLGSANPFTPRGAPRSVRATGLLARALYQDPAWRERYRARLRELLETRWDAARELAELDRWEALVVSASAPERRGRRMVMQRTREFVRRRAEVLRPELEGEARPWRWPERETPGLKPWGRLTADFETRFQERFPSDWLTNGTATMRLELDGKEQAFSKVGVSVSRGLDARQTNSVTLNILALRGLAALRVPTVQAWSDELVVGRPLRVGLFQNPGYYFEGMPTEGGGGAGLLSGTLVFESVGARPGDVVKGRLEAEIWRLPRFR